MIWEEQEKNGLFVAEEYSVMGMDCDVGNLNRCKEIPKFSRETLHFKKCAEEMCLYSSISDLMCIFVHMNSAERRTKIF